MQASNLIVKVCGEPKCLGMKKDGSSYAVPWVHPILHTGKLKTYACLYSLFIYLFIYFLLFYSSVYLVGGVRDNQLQAIECHLMSEGSISSLYCAPQLDKARKHVFIFVLDKLRISKF